MSNNNSEFEKDDLYRTLERINLWIGNCDTKTSIAIGAIGVIFAVLLSKDYVVKFKSIITYMIKNIDILPFLFLTVFSISIIFICLGCYFLFRALVPRTDTNLYKEPGLELDSLIYFSTISYSKTYEDYSCKIEKASESILRNDIISQIFICSKICDGKFKSYKKGIILVLIGFIIFICLMIVGIIII